MDKCNLPVLKDLSQENVKKFANGELVILGPAVWNQLAVA